MKRKIWMLVGLCLIAVLVCAFADAEVVSGTTSWLYGGSEDISFELDLSTGVMTFSGTGGWSYNGNGWGYYQAPYLTDLTSDFYGGYGDYSSSIRKVIVQEGITSVANVAFEGCTNLVEVSLPESVTSIGDYAFKGCTSLLTINFPSDLTTIGEQAFYKCTSLTKCDIPETMNYIGEGAFYGCSSLQRIISYGNIGEHAFGSTGATSAVINNCYTIGSNAFAGNSNLRKAELCDKITNLPLGAFYMCPSLTSVNIPESVTSIGAGAFEKCSSLTSIDIPDSVISIEDEAFRETNLSSITIPDSVTIIGEYICYNCGNLIKAELPSGITSIPEYTFAGCTSLMDVKIPEGPMIIGEKAFRECKSLTQIEIPESVVSIGKSVFEDCESLLRIKIPSGVTSLGEYTFKNCNALISAILPEGLLTIEKGLFQNSGLFYVSLPESVVSIKEAAFSQCNQLSDVYYSADEAAKNQIFIGSSNYLLDNVYWHYNETVETDMSPGKTWLKSYDWSQDHTNLTATLQCQNNPEHSTEEEAQIEVEVTSPTDQTPGSVSYTGVFTSDKFEEQKVEIEIPALSTMKVIILPDQTYEIAEAAFEGCNFEAVILPANCRIIGPHAFKDCKELVYVKVPQGEIIIEDNAFEGCEHIIIDRE